MRKLIKLMISFLILISLSIAVSALSMTCGGDYYYNTGTTLYKQVGGSGSPSNLNSYSSGVDTCCAGDFYFKNTGNQLMKSLAGQTNYYVTGSTSSLTSFQCCGYDAYWVNQGYIYKSIGGHTGADYGGTFNNVQALLTCCSSNLFVQRSGDSYLYKFIEGQANPSTFSSSTDFSAGFKFCGDEAYWKRTVGADYIYKSAACSTNYYSLGGGGGSIDWTNLKCCTNYAAEWKRSSPSTDKNFYKSNYKASNYYNNGLTQTCFNTPSCSLSNHCTSTPPSYSCAGTQPSGSGVVKGPSTYSFGYSPTSWTYNTGATTSTPCKWKCNTGYTQSGNSCIVTCSNQCTPSGTKQCSGNNYQTCTDTNGDGCLEWSSATSCGTTTCAASTHATDSCTNTCSGSGTCNSCTPTCTTCQSGYYNCDGDSANGCESSTPCYTYSWYQSGFGSCSNTCGAGSQSQTVYCKRSDGIQVADSYCTGTKPDASQSCTSYSGCPVAVCQLFDVSCETSMGNINSVRAFIKYLGTELECPFIEGSWNGNISEFSCNATSLTINKTYNVICSINQSSSYQQGSNQSISILISNCSLGSCNNGSLDTYLGEQCEPNHFQCPSSTVCNNITHINITQGNCSSDCKCTNKTTVYYVGGGFECIDGNIVPISGKTCFVNADCPDQTSQCCYGQTQSNNGTCLSSLPLGILPNSSLVDQNSCLCMVSRSSEGRFGKSCNRTGDYPCWYTSAGQYLDRCCGNTDSETWSNTFSTSTSLEDILVTGYCNNGKWKSREDYSLTYYTLVAGR